MNLSKLCNDIQHKEEFSLIKIVEEHLTKQNKRKNSNKKKIIMKIKKFITSNQDFTP